MQIFPQFFQLWVLFVIFSSRTSEHKDLVSKYQQLCLQFQPVSDIFNKYLIFYYMPSDSYDTIRFHAWYHDSIRFNAWTRHANIVWNHLTPCIEMLGIACVSGSRITDLSNLELEWSTKLLEK